VASAVTFAETEDEARAALTDIGALSFPACFSRAFSEAVRRELSDFTIVSTTTTRLPALSVGDQDIGYRAVLKARVSGTPMTIYVDFTFIRSGRAVAIVDTTSASTAPYPNADRLRPATTIAGRRAAR